MKNEKNYGDKLKETTSKKRRSKELQMQMIVSHNLNLHLEFLYNLPPMLRFRRAPTEEQTLAVFIRSRNSVIRFAPSARLFAIVRKETRTISLVDINACLMGRHGSTARLMKRNIHERIQEAAFRESHERPEIHRYHAC